MQLLEKTRSQKNILENKIETLASQYRIVKAASVGSKVQMDNGKLAQTEKLTAQIQSAWTWRFRVLPHESRFVEGDPGRHRSRSGPRCPSDEHFQQHEGPVGADSTPVAKRTALRRLIRRTKLLAARRRRRAAALAEPN